MLSFKHIQRLKVHTANEVLHPFESRDLVLPLRHTTFQRNE